MTNVEIIVYVCGGLFGAVAYMGFLAMFTWAVWKGDYIFHHGRIRGTSARILGIIGLVGMAAGTYLAVGFLALGAMPPFTEIACGLVALLMVTLFFTRVLSLFMRPEN